MFIKKEKYNKIMNDMINFDLESSFYKGAYKTEKQFTNQVLNASVNALIIIRQEMILNCEETVKFELENAVL